MHAPPKLIADRLSCRAKLLATLLWQDASPFVSGTIVAPGVGPLAKRTGLSDSTVRRGLRELALAGWIHRVGGRTGPGRPCSWLLRLSPRKDP